MQLGAEIDCGIIHLLLRDGRVKIQMITSSTTGETVKHLLLQVDGERPALG